ncbi:MAG: hypothetical protein E7653_02920 [Ruminococcaceae bacterium]|nr:hypothetical protein [Oscillospiraceae bacterium]
MRKTEQRKKLARVFAKYYRLGLCDARLSVFEVCRRISGCQRDISHANDLFAAWATVKKLRECDRAEDIELFLTVYLGKRNSVTSLAIKKNYDERTLYRRLDYVESQYKMIRNSIEAKK